MNYHLLNSDKVSYKWIVIDYLTSEGIHRKLVTTRDYFFRYGKLYHFAKQGFELQSFLQIDHFGIEKARLLKAKKVIQQNLFGEEYGINNIQTLYEECRTILINTEPISYKLDFIEQPQLREKLVEMFHTAQSDLMIFIFSLRADELLY